MQFNETSAEGLKREFTVVIAAQDIDAKIEAKLTHISKTVKMPGFRPGKVPLPLISQRYRASVTQEVVDQEVEAATQQVIAERGLRIAMQPNIEVPAYTPGQDVGFTVALELLPDIEPTAFGEIELERQVAEVGEAEVDEMLAKLAHYVSTPEPLTEDRGAINGDVLTIDFSGTVDGVGKDGMDASDHELPLGQGTFLPDFEAALVGVRAGEQRVFTVTFPDNYAAEDLAGKQAVFKVDVKQVRSRPVVAIDDELAKRLGLADLAALRASARSRLTEEYAEMSRNRLKRALMDKLAALHDFPVPPSMVEVEFEAVWSQWQREKTAGRVPASEAERDEESLKAEYHAIAERRVRLGLLLADVGRSNNLKVSNEELSRAIMAEARRYPGHEREVVELFRKNEQILARLRTPLFEAKAIDFILELVKVTDRTVTIEELRQEPDDDGRLSVESA